MTLFKKGHKIRLGMKHTEKTKKKISKNVKKGMARPEVKKKLRELKGNGNLEEYNLKGHKPTRGMLGKKQTKEAKKKISKAKKGCIPWIKGKYHSKETKEKMSKARKGKFLGENHPNWKGGYERKLWHNRCRRIMKLKAEGSHTFEEWEKLKKECDYTCQECRLREPFENQSCKILTEDHIVPLSKGGSDYIENIQPLCRSCNCVKKDKILFVN